jgi:hypothetical protein
MEFVFVDQSGENTQQALQQSRKRIRQQARHHTLAKWKTNRLQSIEIQLVDGPRQSADAPKSKAGISSRRQSFREDQQDTQKSLHRTKTLPQSCPLSPVKIPPNLPPKDYEQARSQHNFDISWLSALALNHVGRAPTDSNASIPSFHRTTVHDWVHFRETSYLDLIPAHYDNSPLIRNLVDALLIKAQDVLSSAKAPKAEVLKVYGKALWSVQDALKDEEAMKSPETLCATQLISMYEVRFT